MPPRSYTIKDLKAFAKKKGGDCLSIQYFNSKQQLLWKCKSGHKWKALRDNIMRGKWCPKCANLEKGSYHRLNLDVLKSLAKERGGRCLSQVYINSKFKYSWKCKNGHCWKAEYNNIKSGKWCPECNRGYAERLCREYFEKSFLEKFPNLRPKWLKSPEGTILEFDGYCERLKIAFEHQGMHHYDLTTHFIIESNALRKRKKIDKLKLVLSRKMKVTLILIPALGYKLPEKKLSEFLFSEFKRLKLPFKNDPRNVEINWGRVYGKETVEQLKSVVKLKEGKILAGKINLRSSDINLKCKEGHSWKTKVSYIMGGSWCPECMREANRLNLSDTIENMHKIAAERSGKCLSEKYENTQSKIHWQCSLGHEWMAIPSNVKKGHWCPVCAIETKKKKLRSSIEEIKEIAKRRNGKCLSEEYVNDSGKLKWKCEIGHVWEASAGSVKGSKNRKGTWCPICSKRSNKRDS